MLMYKHILVTTDGSETSNLALQEAIKLSKELKAKLRIVHVADETFFNTGEVWIDIGKYQEAIRKEGQAILYKAMAIAKKADIAADSHLIEINEVPERIADKIIEDAKINKIDVLVIGTHGRRGFRRFMLGSVAEEVARISPVPVLLIRGQE